MNKLFKPYILTLIILSLLFIINSFDGNSLIPSIDLLTILLLITSSISEVKNQAYKQSIAMSLSGPITIFAVFYIPIFMVYIIIITYTTLSKYYIKEVLKESNHIFDIKWIFNISQNIVLAKIMSLQHELLIGYSINSYKYIIILILVIIINNVLNFILTSLVVLFSSGRNPFKDMSYKSQFLYIYYYIIIIVLMIYSYEAYNLLGISIIFIFVIPIQETIIHNSTITEFKQKFIIDQMTGAYNRTFLEDTLLQYLENNKSFTLLFLDLDDFKNVNDKYGHIIGDKILIDFVIQLKKYIKDKDQIFRYGGDEFCILINKKENVSDLMNNLKESNHFTKTISSKSIINYSYSTGIFSYDGTQDISFNDLIDIVDKHMYTEKKIKNH